MERIKAAVIGIGFIGAAHVEALKRVPGVDVVALVNRHGAAEKAAELDVPQAFADYREMIEVCKPDVIHICTPNSNHKEVALYAFEHGIHVVCEKPLARNAEEAAEMLAAGEKSGLVHAVNFHNRFYPANHQLRNMIQDGALGTVRSVQGKYLQDCFSQETDFNWRMLSQNSGKTRVMADIGSHWVDLAEYVTGMKVKEVFAEFQTDYPVRKMVKGDTVQEIAIDTEDTAYVLLRFENGAVGSAVFSQMIPGKKNQTAILVSGTEAAAEWDSESISELKIGYKNEFNRVLTKDPRLMHPATAPVVSYPGGHVEGFPDAFKQNFIAIYKAIRGETPTGRFATFADGLHAMQVCDKIYESAKSGRWVSLE